MTHSMRALTWELAFCVGSLLLGGCGDDNASNGGTGGGGTNSGGTNNGGTNNGGGGGGDDGTCMPVEGCGGDLTGVWNVKSACSLRPPELGPVACRGAVTIGSFTASGTVTFRNGQVIANFTTSVPATYTLNGACLSALAKREVAVSADTCRQLEQQLADKVADIECSAEATACVCNGTVTSPTTDTEPYAVNGNQVMLGDDSATFCISGDSLALDDEVVTLSLSRAP